MNIFSLLFAIKRELNEEPGYPNASIKHPGGYLIISCQKDNPENQDFAELVTNFETLCKKNGIPKLPNYNQYTQIRELKGVSKEAKNLIKYEFYISSKDFERLLVNEFPEYTGYRHYGSIMRLANPDEEVMKPGAICLFPAVAMDSNKFMLRSAGCNISETISTQLAYYLNKYLDLENKPGQADYYGHYMSPLIRNVLCVSEHELLEIAFSSIGIKPEHIGNDLIQGGGGFRVFKLREKYRSNLVAMNQQAEKIYQRLAPVSHDELPNLRSMEVTVKTMVEQIASTLIDKKLAIENEIKKLKKEMKKLKSDDYNDVKSLKYNALERELRELKIQVLEQKIVVASNNDDPIELQSLEYQLSYLKEIPIPTAESEAEKRRIEINTQLDSLDNRKAELRQSLKYICIVLDVLEAEHLQQQQPKEQTSIRGRQAFFPSSDHISTQVMRGKEDEENNSPPI